MKHLQLYFNRFHANPDGCHSTFHLNMNGFILLTVTYAANFLGIPFLSSNASSLERCSGPLPGVVRIKYLSPPGHFDMVSLSSNSLLVSSSGLFPLKKSGELSLKKCCSREAIRPTYYKYYEFIWIEFNTQCTNLFLEK